MSPLQQLGPAHFRFYHESALINPALPVETKEEWIYHELLLD